MFESCPLCQSDLTRRFTEAGGRFFLNCPSCELIFAERPSRPSSDQERERYGFHQNDVNDSKYQDFVRPLVTAVQDSNSVSAQGIDYGSGPAPIVSHLLKQQGYLMELYDPYFHPNQAALQRFYDFVTCCEVVEHFHNPSAGFNALKKLLKPNGTLFVMTLLWSEQCRFEEWHYQRDRTHVSFYTRKTFEWIRKKYEFSSIEFRSDRLIVLRS